MPTVSASTPPNIILICTDQMRQDALGCTGNNVAMTPHIDRLAREGSRFTTHITPARFVPPAGPACFQAGWHATMG